MKMDVMGMIEGLKIDNNKVNIGGIDKDRYCSFGMTYENGTRDGGSGQLKVFQNGMAMLSFYSDDYGDLKFHSDDSRYYDKLEQVFDRQSNVEFRELPGIAEAYDNAVFVYGEDSKEAKGFKENFKQICADYSSTNQASINNFMLGCAKLSMMRNSKEIVEQNDDHLSHLSEDGPFYLNIDKNKSCPYIDDKYKLDNNISIEIEKPECMSGHPNGDIMSVVPKYNYSVKVTLKDDLTKGTVITIAKGDGAYMSGDDITNDPIYKEASKTISGARLKLNFVKDKIDEKENESKDGPDIMD